MVKIVLIIAEALGWLGMAVTLPVYVVCWIAMLPANCIIQLLVPVFYDPEVTPYAKENNRLLDKSKALAIRMFDIFKA